MEVATTTTEAHLSAIHQSLLQISATLGRMLTYGCVNATSSPDAVVPAKRSTVGLNPNIGAVEVVDSSQQPGIVSTVNPGLVGAPPSSTMQRFGILKSGKHTPTTCSTGVLDVDTDAKNAKRDAGTLQAGLSVHVPWDPGVNNQQIMCTHQELEREIDKSTRLDHVIAGLELVFMEIPSEEGKLQQIVSKNMENYVSQWTLLLPQGWQDVQMILHPTSSKTIELIFSQQLDFRSTTLTFPWDPGNWLWVLQRITSAQFLCLANLSGWSAHSSISWCDMRVWLYLSLYAPEQSTCFRSFPVYMVHLHSGGSGILLAAIEQWNEALKASHAYVMEDPLKTLVPVTWLHTYCSVFCDIHSEGWERKLQWLPWNLTVHNQVIRQGQQELCKCYYLCSLIHMANHLQYKQWDPGVTWIVGAEGIKLCLTQPRWTTDRISWLRRRFLCRSSSCSLLRPDLGIAWGQAMFLGGGIVTTTPRAWSLWALGQPCLAVMDASGVYRGEEVHRKGHEETEQNRPRSASLFPVPVRLVPSLVFPRSGGYHKPQYPSAHAAIPSPATGVTGRPSVSVAKLIFVSSGPSPRRVDLLIWRDLMLLLVSLAFYWSP